MEHTANETPEFAPPTSWKNFTESFRGATSVMATSVRETIHDDTLMRLGGAALGVFGLALYEGLLLTKGGPGQLRLAVRYAYSNILPSIVWSSRSATTVARAAGLQPTHVLKVFSQTAADAKVQLRVGTLSTLRSILAGFVGISEVLRIGLVARESAVKFRKRVVQGVEPISGGVDERIIRLAGRESDVTDYDMDFKMMGLHIIPVYENCAKHKHLMVQNSMGGRLAVALNVERYGDAHAWERLRFERDWLLRIRNSDARALVIEADSSVGEQALALGEEDYNDLTLNEAALGFRSIEQEARRCGVMTNPKDRVVRVLLADAQEEIQTGGGHNISLKTYTQRLGLVDVFIDARMPLVNAVERWAREQAKQFDEKDPYARVLFFDTDNMTYFLAVKHVLAKKQWIVVDPAQKECLCKNKGCRLCDPLTKKQVPTLVYRENTPGTVLSLRQLIKQSIVDRKSCCALLDSQQGVAELDSLSKELDAPVSYVCSAIIYHNLFRSVREMVRDGVSNEKIQENVDHL